MSNWNGFVYPPVARNDIARELYLTSLGRVAYRPGARYPAPGHPSEFQFDSKLRRILGDFAIVWVEEGRGWVEAPGLQHAVLSPGMLLVLPPAFPHSYKPDPDTGWVERWVCVNGTYLHRLRAKGIFPSAPELHTIRDMEALNGAFDHLQTNAATNSLLVAGLLLTVFALALGKTGIHAGGDFPDEPSGDAVVDAAVGFIWNNCHRDIGVASVARHAGVSRRMLERHFSENWARSVAREITMARLRRGRDLLAEETLTVKEAGYAAGFGGAHRFISAHRRVYGTTPGNARRS